MIHLRRFANPEGMGGGWEGVKYARAVFSIFNRKNSNFFNTPLINTRVLLILSVWQSCWSYCGFSVELPRLHPGVWCPLINCNVDVYGLYFSARVSTFSLSSLAEPGFPRCMPPPYLCLCPAPGLDWIPRCPPAVMALLETLDFREQKVRFVCDLSESVFLRAHRQGTVVADIVLHCILYSLPQCLVIVLPEVGI